MSKSYHSHTIPSRPGPVSIAFMVDGRKLRETRDPGADVSDLPREARNAIAAVWTAEYIAGWRAEVAAFEADFAAEELAGRREDVNAERDRRIDLPKTVSLKGGKTFTVDMARGGRENISDLGITAVARQLAGDQTVVSFRDADNIDRDLSPAEIIEMGLVVAAQVQAIHLKARAIKALDPIPADFRDDRRWDLDPD